MFHIVDYHFTWLPYNNRNKIENIESLNRPSSSSLNINLISTY